MIQLFIFIAVCAGIALGFALLLSVKILKADEGTQKMVEIAEAVREGASAYLKRQYYVSGMFFLGWLGFVE